MGEWICEIEWGAPSYNRMTTVRNVKGMMKLGEKIILQPW